jgi:imidazole glycerol phosphate synthase subunit HisF
VPVQYGGGLRSTDAVRDALRAGAERVIVGTAAFRDIDFLDDILSAFGPRVVVSVDVREGRVSTAGWTQTTQLPADDAIRRLGERGVASFVYTNVDRDGGLAGPDLGEIARVAEAVRGRFLYSGGIGTLDDLRGLAALQQSQLEGVIVGKALYEQRFTVAEADEVPGFRGPDVHYKRVIPCMDVDAGRVVKGTRFLDIRDAGDPVELAAHYDAEGADELGLPGHHRDERQALDRRRAGAARGRRGLRALHHRRRRARGGRRAGGARRRRRQGVGQLGGGRAPGADRRAGQRLRRAVRRAGHRRQAPRRRSLGGLRAGGRTPTGRDAVAWAREGVERGAGEILLTSMDRDGTKDGYDLALTTAISQAVDVPVIASGGAGEPEHLVDGFAAGADAVLCASIFHYGQYSIPEVKRVSATRASPCAEGGARRLREHRPDQRQVRDCKI